MDDRTNPDNVERFLEATKRFFSEAVTVMPVEGSLNLVNVTTPAGAFALRQWPRTATIEHVKFVHSVLAGLSDLPFVPNQVAGQDDKLIQQADQHLFDATTWLDGRPVRRPELPRRLDRSVSLPRNVSVETLAEVTSAVARMHDATRSLASRPDTPSLPANNLVSAATVTWMQLRNRLRPIAGVTPDIQRWLRTGERVLPLADKVVSTLTAETEPKFVIAHANIWPEHVLVQREAGDERLTGIVDFTKVIASTPLLDLAQIATRFNGWSDESAEQVIGAYVDVTPLSPVERRVLPAIAAVDLVAETGRVLVTLYVELGSPNASESLRDASDTMLRSLESTTRTLERLEGINQPGPRKWVHRPPRQGQSAKARPKQGPGPRRPAKPRRPPK